MEQNINIAALLKDYPKGTKLYSPICGECEFYDVDIIDKHLPIHAIFNDGDRDIYFSPYGKYYDGGECLLFPSEKMRHWEVFQAKYVNGGNNAKEILEANGAVLNCEEYDYEDTNEVYYIDRINNKAELALLSEKEYLLLNGTELKLKEEQSKFRVGDVVKNTIDNKLFCVLKQYLANDKNSEYECSLSESSVGFFKTSRLATPEEIKRWNEETLEPNHLHYDSEKRKIVDWFLPFDKVLVRDSNHEEWCAGFYSHYKVVNRHGLYFTTAGCACECIPYNEQTMHLVGTTDDWKG